MAAKKSVSRGPSELIAIKKRLRAGALTKADIKKLGALILKTENAAKALRAAMVE